MSYCAPNPDPCNTVTLLVSHDSVHRVALLQVLRLSLSRYWHIRQDPCAVSVLERTGDDWTVHSLNETAHLRTGSPSAQQGTAVTWGMDGAESSAARLATRSATDRLSISLADGPG